MTCMSAKLVTPTETVPLDCPSKIVNVACENNSQANENKKMSLNSTEVISKPGPHDVLMGRGGGTNKHPGNIKFRKLVNEHKLRYLSYSKVDKPKVAREIVLIWRKLDPPGRFLAARKRGSRPASDADNDKDENDLEEDCEWYDIGNKKAREKASQCLRERTPEVLPFLQQLREAQKRQQLHIEHHRRMFEGTGLKVPPNAPNGAGGPFPGQSPYFFQPPGPCGKWPSFQQMPFPPGCGPMMMPLNGVPGSMPTSDLSSQAAMQNMGASMQNNNIQENMMAYFKYQQSQGMPQHHEKMSIDQLEYMAYYQLQLQQQQQQHNFQLNQQHVAAAAQMMMQSQLQHHAAHSPSNKLNSKDAPVQVNPAFSSNGNASVPTSNDTKVSTSNEKKMNKENKKISMWYKQQQQQSQQEKSSPDIINSNCDREAMQEEASLNDKNDINNDENESLEHYNCDYGSEYEEDFLFGDESEEQVMKKAKEERDSAPTPKKSKRRRGRKGHGQQQHKERGVRRTTSSSLMSTKTNKSMGSISMITPVDCRSVEMTNVSVSVSMCSRESMMEATRSLGSSGSLMSDLTDT